MVYDGLGLTLGTTQRVTAEIGETGQRRVTFEDGQRYVVAADGSAIVCDPTPAAAAVEATVERALGGPIALALAAGGIFLLHASALASDRGVVALTAASGGGKSTLAEVAATTGAGGWRRVADDILPVRLDDRSRALPHFPQLKLDLLAAYPADAPVSRRLAAVVELHREDEGSMLQLETLSPASAVLALARATVAARLFPPELLGLHLAACGKAASTLTVARLRYPEGLGRVDRVLIELAHRLG